jgi:hypothetical protein
MPLGERAPGDKEEEPSVWFGKPGRAGAELVSRQVQSGIDLFTGVMISNVAFGGLFARAFALALLRFELCRPSPRSVPVPALAREAILDLAPSLASRRSAFYVGQ